MSNINFKPWVGEKYLTEGFHGKRILVLGESHYCSKELSEGGRCYPLCKKENMREDCFSQTQDVVKEYVYDYRGASYQQTFLCFERAVLGKESSQQEKENFWQSVIFYNYIQYAQDGARKGPQGEHWAASEMAFRKLLEQYMPDYIIVWGVRLYGGLPDWGRDHKKIKISNGDETDVCVYNIKGKKIPAMKVHHPSVPTGKNWPYWHQFYKQFLGI